jgi:ketosteroid isomerase-like protein
VSPGDAQAVVRQFLEREGCGDVDGAAALLADDFVFEQPFAAQGVASRVEGRDVFASHLARYIAPGAGWYSEWAFHDIVTYPGDGTTVFAEWRSEAVVAKNGRPYANVYIARFRVEDGRIKLMREYRDPQRVQAALAD